MWIDQTVSDEVAYTRLLLFLLSPGGASGVPHQANSGHDELLLSGRGRYRSRGGSSVHATEKKAVIFVRPFHAWDSL